MKLRLVLGSCALALVASACGGYDRQANLDELQDEAGLTEPQAVCVLDKLEDEIGTDRLGSNDDPTPEEEQIIISASLDCLTAAE